MSEKRSNPDPIIINATNLGTYLDGIGTYTLNLLREISASKSAMRFIIYVNRAAECHLSLLRFPEHCSVRWVSEKVSPDHGFLGHLLRLLLANLIALFHIRSPLFTSSQLEAAFFRSRQVIMIHDVIPILFRSCHRKQYFYFRRMLPIALRKARIVVTPSRHTKGLLEQIYRIPSDRIRVIHHGVRVFPEKTDQPSPGGLRPFILYTGRIARMKNITGILKAFAMIQDKIPHRILITGHGRERTNREFDRQKLMEYGIVDDRVLFSGHVSFEEMGALLRNADLLVFPSFYEGFGFPPLEAMAAGCPVVVSHTGSLPEVCGNAAFYVDPYDIESIADGMYKMLSDGGIREALVRRGFERVASFSWERSFAQLLCQFARLDDVSVAARAHRVAQPMMSR